MFFIFRIFILISTLIYVNAVYAKSLTFLAEGWCPYTCPPSHNKNNGYLVDIVKAVFEKKGYSIDYEVMPYRRAIIFARTGKVNAIIGIYKEDAPDLIFPNTHQGLSRKYFFVNKNANWRYSGVSSLNELNSIGIMLGYDYGELSDYLEKSQKIVSIMTGFNMLELTLKQLLTGRIQTFADDRLVVNYMLNRMGVPKGQVIEAGQLGETNKVYIAFSPEIEESKLYAEILEQGIDQLRDSGELAKILQKYKLKDREDLFF